VVERAVGVDHRKLKQAVRVNVGQQSRHKGLLGVVGKMSGWQLSTGSRRALRGWIRSDAHAVVMADRIRHPSA
jgi:hypothetical protein